MTAVLRATGIVVSFGGVVAVDGADLHVDDGELVGLIGPNGAGKTTLIDAITGFVRSRGEIELDGTSIAGLPAHARARRGLSRTWQTIELFDDLTVRENLTVVSAGEAEKPAADVESVEGAIRAMGLEAVLDAMPDELTQSDRKRVGIARALVARPRLLCLDEPAAGFDVGQSRQLGRQLRELADAGQATLLVDHDMGLVLSICDRVVVLNFGKVIADGPPEELRRDERVISAYLGGAAGRAAAEAVGHSAGAGAGAP